MILSAIVALALLGIIAQGQFGRRSLAARVAARFVEGSRSRRTLGWAAGTAVTYALPALAALFVLGHGGSITHLPPEFVMEAHRLGLPATMTGETAEIGASLLLGMAIGTGLLYAARRFGRRPRRFLYRSPAAIRGWNEAPAAATLAVSAGVSEELFFRLALPLAVTGATGSVIAGLATGTIVFGLAHRYQGWIGLALTTLVGAGLAWLYLVTGTLWVAMLVHAAVDIHALVVRPWVGGEMTGQAANRGA